MFRRVIFTVTSSHPHCHVLTHFSQKTSCRNNVRKMHLYEFPKRLASIANDLFSL